MTAELSYLCAAIAAAGLLQAAAGLFALSKHQRRLPGTSVALPPITILKPLHGAEPLLEQALATFCAQSYPTYQIVFGVQNPSDPALKTLARLRQRFPALDMEIVVDSTPHGTNHKIANLLNMFGAAKHDTLVIADSDIHAAPDYLHHLATTLAQPGTGLVTTLYAGLPADTGLAGALGAAQINHSFLPGALLARAMGRQDCLGATMALTRDTLASIGGLGALSHHLADDAVLGRLVAEQGLSVALAPTIPSTTIPETTIAALLEHELRWARTIRSLVPVGFALSIAQFPIAWAALALLCAGLAPWACAFFAATWFIRAALAATMDRALGVTSHPYALWWMPGRDLMSVAVILASYRTNRVAWRGHSLRAIPPPRVIQSLAATSGYAQGITQP